MLNTPDIYNEFADMIDKNFKYKLENNLLKFKLCYKSNKVL